MTAKAARFRDSNRVGKQEKFKTGQWRKLLVTRTLRTMLRIRKSP